MIAGWVWGGLGQKEKNRSQSDPKTEKTDG